MSLASAKRILMPTAVVLSVGWSAFAVGFAWFTAPDAGAFRADWQPRGGDPMAEEQTLRAAAAGHAGATFGVSPQVAAAKRDADPVGATVKGIDATRGVRSEITLFTAFTAAIWLLPIAAVWSVVWIVATRPRRQSVE
jgi:hypothetical protein